MASSESIYKIECELRLHRFQTFDDVVDFLDKIPKFSQSGASAAHYELDHVTEFCRLMGDPQHRLRAIHVAGTNGKGTTCQLLASVYEQAGYKTGIYTSPHLLVYNERIRVNGQMIPDSSILEFFQRYEKVLDSIPLTYFEISTCMAFWYFEQQDCDICIIETGLGGRLDATNVIRPIVSVITSVSLDHTDFLGDSIADIAREKAGIIKKEIPVATGRISKEARKVLEEAAVSNHTKINDTEALKPHWSDGSMVLTDPDSGAELRINGNGRKLIDVWNVALARLATFLIAHELPMSVSEFMKGTELMNTRFSEHAHYKKLSDHLEWYFDGAHNDEAVQTLIEQINQDKGGREPVLFLSLMKDKLNHNMLENFQPFKNVYYIDTGTERCANCNQILSLIPQARCYMADNPELTRILDRFKSELVIFAGSFYFYRQVKNWMASQLPSDHTSDFKISQ
jgi:dihydrofolate synthase / folylpolyglutamate synthase